MLRRDDFFPYLVFSVSLHILILYSVSHNKKNHVYLTSPIEVTFYSLSRQTSDQSMSEALADYNQETLRQISNQSTPEVLSDYYDRGTFASPIKEETVAKKDIVVKKKDNQKKVVKEKSKIQTKKTRAQSVNQIVENQIEEGNSSGNSSNIETFQSPDSLLSSTSTGSLYGGVSFDAQDFQYSYYTGQIIRKIGRQWRWTESYDKLRSLVYFRIHRDGTAYDISIKESSGNSEYDKNALDTVCRATPFPELPEGYNGESLGVFFEFKVS